MELTDRYKKLPEWVGKYKYVILVLGIGILLMIFPFSAENTDSEEYVRTESSDAHEASASQELAEILSSIEGAGRVQVMLSVSEGSETLYQINEDQSSSSDSVSLQTETVTITDSGRNETGLVRQINPPRYLGALVVCQGADSPAVRLAITDAVSKITGLGADRISILKME